MPTIMDATSHPDEHLCKEVLAHFGLCMYFAQVFETGLITILTVLEASAKRPTTRQEYTVIFDALYERHETLTFGNLLKALAKHNFLPDAVMTEAQALKTARDHLAHRFFRDHDLDALTIAGCQTMIAALEKERIRFMDLDQRVSDLVDAAYEKVGIGRDRLKSLLDAQIVKMSDEARTRYSSPIPKPG